MTHEAALPDTNVAMGALSPNSTVHCPQRSVRVASMTRLSPPGKTIAFTLAGESAGPSLCQSCATAAGGNTATATHIMTPNQNFIAWPPIAIERQRAAFGSLLPTT